ncbi:hypothetical protein D9M71_426750 [compost metagenome]
MALDSLADNIYRFQAHQLELSHAVAAKDRGELLKAMADSANQLAAIAPAGAPTDLARLQQDHIEAAFGQFDCRVQPGKTAADHADVTTQFALLLWVIRLWDAAGSVVGSGVRGGLLNAGVHGIVLVLSVWKILRRISCAFRGGQP